MIEDKALKTIQKDQKTARTLELLNVKQTKAHHESLKAGKFLLHHTIQTYLLGEEEVSTGEEKFCLPITFKLVWVIKDIGLSPQR